MREVFRPHAENGEFEFSLRCWEAFSCWPVGADNQNPPSNPETSPNWNFSPLRAKTLRAIPKFFS